MQSTSIINVWTDKDFFYEFKNKMPFCQECSFTWTGVRLICTRRCVFWSSSSRSFIFVRLKNMRWEWSTEFKATSRCIRALEKVIYSTKILHLLLPHNENDPYDKCMEGSAFICDTIIIKMSFSFQSKILFMTYDWRRCPNVQKKNCCYCNDITLILLQRIN